MRMKVALNDESGGALPSSRPHTDVGSWTVYEVIAIGALLAGMGELLLRLVASRVRAVPTFIDPASTWMAPVSAALTLAVPVAVLWVIGRRRDAATAWKGPLGFALFFACYDVLLLVPRLHPAAIAMVAAGLAVQLVRLAARFPQQTRRASRVVMAGLGAISIVGGAAVTIAKATSNYRLARATANGDAPNVLLLVLDTVRALELSTYAYSRETSPHLSAFAAEGVRFERAVSTAPWTLPSHATLFTGLYPRQLSTGWMTPLDGAAPTLAERFTARGYATGGFVANFRYTTHEYGLARGFQVYHDYAFTWSAFVGSTMVGRQLIGQWNLRAHQYVLAGRKSGDQVVDEFLAFEAGTKRRPFFAFLNFFDAHEPYAPDAPYDRMFLASEPGTRAIQPELRSNPRAVSELRDAYDGSLVSLDATLGRLFDELRRRGTLDRTIIVVTSDHGEEFAEHGHLSHGNGLNFPALHVPLVIRWPAGGVPAGAVIPQAVSIRDVPATLLQLSGDRSATAFPGVSLSALWSGGDATVSPVLSELYRVVDAPSWYPVTAGNMHSLVSGRLHLILGPASAEALYDVTADPFERQNLAADPAYADALRTMRATLTAMPLEERNGR